MRRQKIHRDGWATAQEPQLVTSPAREHYISPMAKRSQAEALRAAVEAHIRSGGSYVVVGAPQPAKHGENP